MAVGGDATCAGWGSFMWVRCFLVGLALAPLVACGPSGPAFQDPPPDITAIVEIADGQNFQPAEITIQVGDRIEWRNMSGEIHTVTADWRIVPDPTLVQLPEGAEPFNSAMIPPGQIFRHTFTVPGTYRYVSLPHGGERKIGVVIVQPGS